MDIVEVIYKDHLIWNRTRLCLVVVFHLPLLVSLLTFKIFCQVFQSFYAFLELFEWVILLPTHLTFISGLWYLHLKFETLTLAVIVLDGPNLFEKLEKSSKSDFPVNSSFILMSKCQYFVLTIYFVCVMVAKRLHTTYFTYLYV